jgi:RNA polymerase sigma-70 factor (ECF subfamily)
VASFVETHGHAANEGDFEALYETYKSDVQRLASYLLKNATDAEDAAQTVFLNVLRALRQGVTPSDPRAWLLAITRNVCFSRRRAAAARPAYVELDPEVPDEPGDGHETPSADEIVGALARLLPNHRTALILRDFRGVSRAEICELMSLSPVAVEALLTRARAAFREELQAGDQPFACAETRALVEQQLDGLITVSDRHSLRSHLRHCAPCSTLARAVRSSRGKLAGLLFWPVDLIARLVAAFSEAPSVVHVATGLTSAAAVTAVAIPVAVSTSHGAHHAARPAVVAAPPAAIVAAPAAAAARPAAGATQPVSRVSLRAAAAKPAVHARPQRRPARPGAARPQAHAKPAGKDGAAPVTHTTTTTSMRSTTNGSTTSGPTTTGSIVTPTQNGTTRASAHSSAAPASGLVTPRSGSSPRSSSPALRPSGKPKASSKSRPKPKAKPRKSPKRGAGRRAPAPPLTMPGSAPPAAGLPPAGNGAEDGAGPGIVLGRATTPAAVPQAKAAADESDTAASNGSTLGTSKGKSADAAAKGDDTSVPGEHGKKHHPE